jgi:hypothetical protein
MPSSVRLTGAEIDARPTPADDLLRVAAEPGRPMSSSTITSAPTPPLSPDC